MASIIGSILSEGNINIQIILKKSANPNLVLNNLLVKTDLQTNFNYNMVTLLDKQLSQSNIVDALYAFIEHGLDVIKRRTEYDADKARIFLLESYIHKFFSFYHSTLIS